MKYKRIVVLAVVVIISTASIYSKSNFSFINRIQDDLKVDTLLDYTNRFLKLLAEPDSPACAEMYSLLAETYKIIPRQEPDSITLEVLSGIAYYCAYYNYMRVEYAKSRDYYLDVLDFERMKGDTSSRRFYISLSQIGLTYFNEHRYSESLNPFLQSVSTRERELGKNSDVLITPLMNLASVYVELPALEEAESAAQRAENLILETGLNKNLLCKIYYTLARIYKEKGDFNTAKSYLAKASSSFFEFQGDSEVLLLINNFEAVLARNMNDTLAAIEAYEKSTGFIRSGKYSGSSGSSVYSNYGFYLGELGRLDKAESMFLKAIDYSKTNFGHYSSQNIQQLENYAFFLVDIRKSYKRAEVIYSELFGRLESVNDISVLTDICRGYAKIKIYREDFDSALQLYYMVDQRQDEMSPFNRAYYLQGRGEVYLNYYEYSGSLDHITKALSDFDLAMHIIDSSKVDLGREESRLDLTGQFDFFSDKAIKSAYLLYRHTSDNKYMEKAFTYSEKSKASTLLTATRETRAMKFHINDSLLFYEKMLTSKIKELEAMIYVEKGKDSINRTLLNDLENDRLDVFTDREKLIKRFENEYPDYYRLKHNTVVSRTSDVESYIDRRVNFLEYYATDSVLYTFVINRKGSFLGSVKIDSTYRKTIKQFRNDLVKPIFENGARDQFYRIIKNGYYLYNILIKPIEDQLVSRKLLIAADDLLSYIPFESLVSDTSGINAINYRDLDFLFRKFDIEYAYSATLLLENPGKGRNITNKALVFAPWYKQGISPDSIMISRQIEREELKDIQGAKEEAIYISELLGGDLYVDSDATEINFIRNCRKPRIVHLAMHTLMNDREPMFSRMVFSYANDSIEDGLLNTYEVYDLELDAKMVVLSSCNTGTGYLRKGEGVISLARSFMFAGSPSVVMSLWEVDDLSGTQIIKSFYKNLKQGRSKSESLRRARKKYLSEAGQMHSHPYFWSSLVILGEDEPLFYNWRNILLVPGLILLIAGVIYYFRQYSS